MRSGTADLEEAATARRRVNRRDFLLAAAAAPLAVRLALLGLSSLVPTPACGEEREATPSHVEGPYYKPRSPERRDLRAGLPGGTLSLRGRVLSTSGEAISGALLDFWQADARGGYDNEGYRLRGRQFSSRGGGYELLTVVPGPYLARTPHVHVKVEPPGGRALTTQLFLPDHPRNRTDPLYREDLRMAVRAAAGGLEAVFDFVLRIG
jgi:protocatechuate 3,4-dioxygenase beta subunit